jgi:hypothetical protein
MLAIALQPAASWMHRSGGTPLVSEAAGQLLRGSPARPRASADTHQPILSCQPALTHINRPSVCQREPPPAPPQRRRYGAPEHALHPDDLGALIRPAVRSKVEYLLVLPRPLRCEELLHRPRRRRYDAGSSAVRSSQSNSSLAVSDAHPASAHIFREPLPLQAVGMVISLSMRKRQTSSESLFRCK